MAASRRNFMVLNVVLIALIGGMIWFLATRGDNEFVNLPKPENKPAAEPALLGGDLPAQETEEIQALKAALEAEKALAQQTRAKIQARQPQNGIPPTPALPGNNTREQANPDVTGGLEVEEQKQRIAKMIEAQLKGAAQQNARLAQQLAQKNREIEVVKQQNTKLSQRLTKLDSSAQSLLETLIKDGKRISSSDQNYLGAIQDLARETASPQQANLADADLINRVEVADNDGNDTVTSELRSMVNDLMSKPAEGGNTNSVNNQLNTTSGAGNSNIQNSIDQLMSQNSGQASQQQNANQAYLASLTPVEEERRNETRWVTVREGDTLYDIAVRVYEDGYLYPKIFQANPQVLSNPDRIKPGQRLRVPL